MTWIGEERNKGASVGDCYAFDVLANATDVMEVVARSRPGAAVALFPAGEGGESHNDVASEHGSDHRDVKDGKVGGDHSAAERASKTTRNELASGSDLAARHGEVSAIGRAHCHGRVNGAAACHGQVNATAS